MLIHLAHVHIQIKKYNLKQHDNLCPFPICLDQRRRAPQSAIQDGTKFSYTKLAKHHYTCTITFFSLPLLYHHTPSLSCGH